MKSLQFVTLLGSLSILMGCKEESKTVDWYKTHEKERQEMLAKCKNNPGELENTPNCINAKEGEWEAVKNKF